MNNVLFVDLCNTVANVNAELQKRGVDTDHYPATFKTYETIHWDDILKEAAPIEPVISLVHDLSHQFNVIYLTARPIHTMRISLEWIHRHGLPQAPILHTRGRDKGRFVAHYGDRVAGIIEDSPSEIKSVLEVNPNIDLYIPDWSYNREFTGKRIRTERQEQVLVDRLHVLYSAMGDLSLLWESLDDEQIRLLEDSYPFHRSLGELTEEIRHWMQSINQNQKSWIS